MSRASTTRWLIAVPAAILAGVIGLALVAVVWKSLAWNATNAQMAAATLGTIAAAYAGILVAPPQNRKIASYVFVGILVAVSIGFLLASLVEHTSMIANLNMVAGSIVGGFIVLRTRPLIELGRNDNSSRSDKIPPA